MADNVKNENNDRIANVSDAKQTDEKMESSQHIDNENKNSIQTEQRDPDKDSRQESGADHTHNTQENKENHITDSPKKTDKTSKSKPTKSKAGKVTINDKPDTVTIKLVQTHYDSHSKSSLPHILTEYGLEDTRKKNDKSKQHERPRRRAKKAQSGDETDDEDKARRKTRELSLRHNFGDTGDGDSYYAEYIEFLEEKVQQQRRALREKEEADKLAALKALEQSIILEQQPPEPVAEQPSTASTEKQNHRFERKLERIELHHDDTFLQGLPKTDLSRILLSHTFRKWIVLLQDKMRGEGKLRTQGEVDRFWRDIRKPDVFYQHFKVYPKDQHEFEDGENVNHSAQNGTDDVFNPGPDPPPRSLSHISEASNKESWAITQKFSSTNGPKSAGSEKARKNSTQMARDAALDLERRCPKLEMPPLACFSLNLGEKPPDPDEALHKRVKELRAIIMRKMELKAREKTRKKSQRKLQKMYNMAMANTAVANRILAQHGDLTNILEGAALRDVIAVFDEPYEDLEDYYREIADPSRALDLVPESAVSSLGSRTQPSGSRQSSAGSRRLTPISDADKKSAKSKRRRSKKTPEIQEPPRPLPLSYDEVYTREKTVEAKCLSTMWTNYSGAGKSLFAPS